MDKQMEVGAVVLSSELTLIKNMELRAWTSGVLDNAPEYFFTAAASSTGKYHPLCTIKEGGLIVHVKRAVYIGNRLCDGWGIAGIDKDIVLSAIILHDIAKTGKGQGSYEDYENHPLNAKKYFVDCSNSILISVEMIETCITHHMGLWTPESVKKPLAQYTLDELLVYTADYMSSTKDLITPEDFSDVDDRGFKS